MPTVNTQLLQFCEWLVRTSIQASVLVALILLVRKVLRDRLPAHWHYWLWVLLLIRLATPWAPKTRLSVFNVIPHTVRLQQREPTRPTAVAGQRKKPPAVTSKADDASAPKGATSPQPTEQPQPTPTPARPQTPSRQQAKTGRALLAGFWNVLPFVWLTGAAGLGGLVLMRNFSLWRMVKRERPVTDSQILELLEDCKMQMGVQTILGVIVTDRVKGPALFGFVRPRLLLPQGLIEDLGFDELYYVFIHELAHLKRRDIYLGWLISLLQILHWFNPLMWLAFHRMRLDREFACDALAVSTMAADERPAYGRTVVNLLERFSQVHYMPSIAGILEDSSQIERRIKVIAKSKKTSRVQRTVAVLMLAALCATALTDAYPADARLQSGPSQAELQLSWEIAAAGYGGGSGTPADPYLIHTAEEMNAIGANPGDWDKHFKLMADIDLSTYTGQQFNIIGIDGFNFFSGVFDGNGKRIYNFNYSSSGEKNVALFGFVSTGTIKNLRMIDPNVEAGAAYGVRSAGSLVGQLWEATVTDCYVEGCTVSAAGDRATGGLVGTCGPAATITNCSATGTVSANNQVGGLVGSFQGTMAQCCAAVDVSGNWQVGGLVGWNQFSGTRIVNCYATGSVLGNDKVGGLVGLNAINASIVSCYSIGPVTGGTEAGGLLGRNVGMISDSFWDTQTSGRSNMCGYQHSKGTGCSDAYGKTTAEMQTESTFTSAGWDFVNTWDICPGSYPVLRWQIPLADLACPDGGLHRLFVLRHAMASAELQPGQRLL